MIYLLGVVAAALVLLALVLVARIGGLEARVARLEGQRDPGPYRSAPAPSVVHVPAGSEDEDPAIVNLLEQEDFIGAIKRYRELTGADLRESKAAVEAIRDRRR